ncbi:hypothetical protein J2736_006075 [Paenibacillus qinlingensis]|uniref:Uncharacterized protein n=1 Tax=Paenibacillus qinlingensis TaxID=1837343 RepID=A0ABU1P511_9BACL|nr:hypothetical protein [Paenibacillus qinlingensis]
MGVCNCPVCQVGVVENVGYIELKEGPLEFKFSQFPPAEKAAITIGICSRGSCQYVGMGATPESRSLARSCVSDLFLSMAKHSKGVK